MSFNRYIIVFFLLIVIQEAFCQQIYIPYRLGKLWGLADTSGSVVVKPIYDEIERVSFSAERGRRGDVPAAFFVKKNGKFGYIQGTHVILQPTHGRLYCLDSLFIIDYYKIDDKNTFDSDKHLVYNLRGEQLLVDSIFSIEKVGHSMDQNSLYAIRAQHEKSALIWYNAKQQQIEQTIINNVRWVNTGGSYDKTRLYLFIYKGKSEVPEKYDLTFNEQTKRYVVGPPIAAREEPRLTLDDGMGGYHSIKNNYVLRNFSFKINPVDVDILVETRRYHENKATVSHLSYQLNGGTAELKTFLYDKTHSQWYSTKPYNDFEVEKIDTIFEYQNYVQIKKDGKFGLICGRTVIKPLYDSISSFRHLGYNIPYFVVAKRSIADHKLKWGIVNANNQVIIPCVYDQLTGKNNLLWIIKKGTRYGLINSWNGKVRLPALYDNVVPNNEYSWSFTVMQNGRYGFADDRVISKPIFPFRVDGWIGFQNYNVFYIKGADDNFSGYADKKGFAYFKNE